jgi:hypothetical protein
MHRRTSLAVAAIAGSAALVAGCGSSSSGGAAGSSSNNSSLTPAAELTSAVTNLGHATTLTTSLKLGANASQISALARSQGSSISPSEASTIAGAAVTVEIAAPSGKTLDDLSGTTGSGAVVDFSVSDNGTKFLSLRSVSHKVYVQADLKDLLNKLGQASTYQSLSAESSSLPSFFQALIAGKWVSIASSSLTSLTGTAPGGSGASANPSQQEQFINELKTILTKDVTVARTSSGSTDQLALSADSRTIAQDVLADLSTAVPGAGAALGTTNTQNIPNRRIKLNASVTNGALSALSLDLGQFDTSKQVSLPVQLTFAQNGAAITAPAGAVPVDTSQLSQLLQGFVGGFQGGLPGSGG